MMTSDGPNEHKSADATRPVQSMSAPGKTWSSLLTNLSSTLKLTFFHPQWFAYRLDNASLKKTCEKLNGLVIDIGCADAKPRTHLPADTEYLGIDYYATATEWYATRPDLYADAQSLPLRESSVNHVLLLDVLEHLPHPVRCLEEAYRVLMPGGTLTVQVPFLYPVHDAPLDFQRWTQYGLNAAAKKAGFTVISINPVGHPLESAALNFNIALSKTCLNWIRGKNVFAIVSVLLPPAVTLINLFAWIGARLSKPDPLMPYSYRTTWTKPSCDT